MAQVGFLELLEAIIGEFGKTLRSLEHLRGNHAFVKKRQNHRIRQNAPELFHEVKSQCGSPVFGFVQITDIRIKPSDSYSRLTFFR